MYASIFIYSCIYTEMKKAYKYIYKHIIYVYKRTYTCICTYMYISIYLYVNIYIYIHYHNVVPLSRISLTLSRHFSLSFIASGWSSELHPVSSHSCWMYVRAGHPTFARPYVGVHRSASLMSYSLLLQHVWFV